MFYGLNNNKRIHISEYQNEKCICPICHTALIPKRGDIRTHHFAHKDNICSDDWVYDELDLWHQQMIQLFPRENQEQMIKANDQTHFADILIDHTCILFGPMSGKEFKKRNQFFTRSPYRVIYIFNMNEEHLNYFRDYDAYHFDWVHPKRTFHGFDFNLNIDLYFYFDHKIGKVEPTDYWAEFTIEKINTYTVNDFVQYLLDGYFPRYIQPSELYDQAYRFMNGRRKAIYPCFKNKENDYIVDEYTCGHCDCGYKGANTIQCYYRMKNSSFKETDHFIQCTKDHEGKIESIIYEREHRKGRHLIKDNPASIGKDFYTLKQAYPDASLYLYHITSKKQYYYNKKTKQFNSIYKGKINNRFIQLKEALLLSNEWIVYNCKFDPIIVPVHVEPVKKEIKIKEIEQPEVFQVEDMEGGASVKELMKELDEITLYNMIDGYYYYFTISSLKQQQAKCSMSTTFNKGFFHVEGIEAKIWRKVC